MSQNEIVTKIEELRSYEELIQEAEKAAEELRNAIKAEMVEQGVEELHAGKFIVHYVSVLSSRFDGTAFKKEHADLYKAFLKQVSSRRFTISN